MRARLVAFPIKGRNWAFGSIWVDPKSSSSVPSTFKELWKTISSPKTPDKPSGSNVELVVDFCSNKMNNAWTKLEKAPEDSFKSKLHRFGLKLLSRVKPSENFLKSIPKDAVGVDITYPSCLNARLVRRRLRHIAYRGSVLHKNHFYGSLTLLPHSSLCGPAIAQYSILLGLIPHLFPLESSQGEISLAVHFGQAMVFQGSEKLLQLVSDNSTRQEPPNEKENEGQKAEENSERGSSTPSTNPWWLQPCDELQRLLQNKDADDSLDDSTILDICERFKLDKTYMLKYRDQL